MLLHFFNFSLCVILLFEHKKRSARYLTESPFQELQRTARLDYHAIFPDLMNSQ